jgi:hypothetical protein
MKSDLGLAALLSPDPDLLCGWRIADVSVPDVDLRLSSALAAAQLAFTAAADGLGSKFTAKADATWLPPLPFDSTSSGSSGGCPLGFSNPAVYKQYPIVHVPSTLSLLTPKQLLWLFLKNSGIVLLLQVCIESIVVVAFRCGSVCSATTPAYPAEPPSRPCLP